MTIRTPGNIIDERFLDRRRRSLGIAGLAGALTAGGLFLYRLFVNGRMMWELFAVVAVMTGVKLGLMAWYHFTD